MFILPLLVCVLKSFLKLGTVRGIDRGAFHSELPQILVGGDHRGKKVAPSEINSQNLDGEEENEVCHIA